MWSMAGTMDPSRSHLLLANYWRIAKWRNVLQAHWKKYDIYTFEQQRDILPGSLWSFDGEAIEIQHRMNTGCFVHAAKVSHGQTMNADLILALGIQPSFIQHPDRKFQSFRALNPRILCCSKWLIGRFWDSWAGIRWVVLIPPYPPHPTAFFINLEPRIISGLLEGQTSRSTDFKALKLWKGRSGKNL